MKTLLIIFAKEPLPGQVKSRLGARLGPVAAARLYDAFLQDILEEMGRLSGLALALAYSPAGARSFFQRLLPGALLFPQDGPDLGARMSRAFECGFTAGFDAVLLRGSDTPDLPGQVLLEAQAVLAAGKADLVLGPARDGGYYLMGLKSPEPRLFEGPAWSTAGVLTATLKLAARLALTAHLLPCWQDIDTMEDLLAFRRRGHPAPAPGWRSQRLAEELLP